MMFVPRVDFRSVEIGMLTAYLLVSYRLVLRDTAVDEQFRSRNVAATAQSRRPDRRGGSEIRRCPLARGATTNRRSQAPHFGNRPEQRSCTSSLASFPR